MAITEATKVSDCIQYTEDGKVTVKTITGTHIVISFPIDGYNEVLNVYVDPITEILTVAYDGGSFELAPTAATDHGGLTGLTDDDHTQYIKADGTRAFSAYVDMGEAAVPASPAANVLRLYTENYKGFSFLSFKDSTGMERKIVRDSVFVGKNDTISTIAKARIVYASGSSDDVPTIALAKADSTTTMPAIGVTIESIAAGAFGRVMQVGLLENVNTNSLAVGNILYASEATAGVPTITAPTYPNIRQEIGTVLVKSATVGSIQIVARSAFNDAVIDHGALLGLTDDDHTQYVLATGTRAMGELRLTPKASSSGPEGTMFYDSDDDHVYVGTE